MDYEKLTSHSVPLDFFEDLIEALRWMFSTDLSILSIN